MKSSLFKSRKIHVRKLGSLINLELEKYDGYSKKKIKTFKLILSPERAVHLIQGNVVGAHPCQHFDHLGQNNSLSN